MNAFKKLFKQTFIYGLATVFPRILSFLLVALHTDANVLQSVADYGVVSKIFAWFVILNVVLAYGMETAFFRFYHKKGHSKREVISTSALSLLGTSVSFFVISLLFQDQLSSLTNIRADYFILVIWILLLDALVIIPFAWLRANERPIRYSVIKILNVVINLGLNLFFLLWLPKMATSNSVFETIYRPYFEINYIFIANLIASGVTLLLMAPFYFKIKYAFSTGLWKTMLQYALPVLIAGIAFSINEAADRLLLDYLLPKDIAETQIGMYSACYKLGVFMMLFATAFRLGIEPYFFSHSNSKNPQEHYATILEVFVVLGSVILLAVTVFSDILKLIFIRSEAYWEAMWIVPLILLANLCLGIYHNLSVWYKVTDKTRFGAQISIFGAIIFIVLNVLLIPEISYKGSAIATLAAYGSMMLLSFVLGRKHYPIPYNVKKMGIYLLVSIVFSFLSFYIFNRNLIIGAVLLLVFLAMIYRFEKQTIKLLIKNR